MNLKLWYDNNSNSDSVAIVIRVSRLEGHSARKKRVRLFSLANFVYLKTNNMLHLFSTKAALRKAMVGLSNYTGAYPSSGKTIEAIANYLTDGGLSQMDAKIKAQEEIVASLERQSKSLAEVTRAQEKESERLSDGIVKKAVTLSDLGLAISEAESKLDSLVAQIGAAEHLNKDASGEGFEDQLYKDASLDFKHTPVPQ